MILSRLKNKNNLSLFIIIISVFIIQFLFLDFSNINLNEPIVYAGGDNIVHFYYIKAYIKKELLLNLNLSAPNFLNLNDYPIMLGEQFHFYVYKFFNFLFKNNNFFIINLYFLLKFYIIALISFFALRKFSITETSSIFGALIFSFVPIAFYRFFGHFFLGIYFSIPLAVLLIKNIIDFKTNDSFSKFFKYNFFIIILISISGVHFIFFTIFYLICLSVIFLLKKTEKNIYVNLSIFSIILIITSCLLFSYDTLNFIFKDTINQIISKRSLFLSETFTLKPISLFLPIENHYLNFFSKLRLVWNSSYFNGENIYNSAGIISSIGLLFLVFLPVIYGLRNFSSSNSIINFLKMGIDDIANVKLLSFFVISSLIFFSFGGFEIIGLKLFPFMRSYSRVSIFLCFFGIICFCILLDSILYNKLKLKKNGLLAILLIITFLTLGLFDQIGKRGPLQQLHPDFYSDQSFFKKIDKSLPKGSMVFQLPVMPFPEHPPMSKMLDYDHLRAYVHSENIHWSYPAMRGRNTLKWQIDITETPIIKNIIQVNLNQWKNYHKNIPIEKIINNLSAYGFKGIYIDRFGFEDNGIAIEKALNEKLKSKPIISDNQRMSFYLLMDNPYKIIMNKNNYPKYFIKLSEFDHNKIFLPKYLKNKKFYKYLNDLKIHEKIDIYPISKEYFKNLYIKKNYKLKLSEIDRIILLNKSNKKIFKE